MSTDTQIAGQALTSFEDLELAVHKFADEASISATDRSRLERMLAEARGSAAGVYAAVGHRVRTGEAAPAGFWEEVSRFNRDAENAYSELRSVAGRAGVQPREWAPSITPPETEALPSAELADYAAICREGVRVAYLQGREALQRHMPGYRRLDVAKAAADHVNRIWMPSMNGWGGKDHDTIRAEIAERLERFADIRELETRPSPDFASPSERRCRAAPGMTF